MHMDAAGGATPDQQRDALTRAIGYEDDYLQPETFLAAATRLFDLRVQADDYAGALWLLDRVRDSKRAEQSPQYEPAVAGMDAAARQIKALVDGDTTIRINAAIGRFDYWVHNLLRRSFSITDINGQLDAVEVRCSKRNARYYSVTGTHSWTIPESWGDCGAYVKGTPGTTFAFYEDPKQK
jgi:hypothetical protein